VKGGKLFDLFCQAVSLITLWKPEPHLLFGTERANERGGDEVLEVLYVYGFH
jgi:hypothetical protein